ncbi:MAG: hypothetical protein M3336_07340 [Chloroflexota bacterium]|nr:hypothetical protein [Chloroflexota bacterium]
MEAHATDGRIAQCMAVGGRYRAAAAGVIVVLALTSASALGFAAVVERLTTTDATARPSAVQAGQARLMLPVPRVADRWYDAPQAVMSTSPAHVVDRWYDEPAAATAGTTRVEDRWHDGATRLGVP